MKITRKYKSGCRWCNGTGFVFSTSIYAMNTSNICIEVIEEFEEPETIKIDQSVTSTTNVFPFEDGKARI